MRVKDSRYIKLINSSRWRNLRHTLLVQNPLCVDCKTEGFITPACEIHHEKPWNPSDPPAIQEQMFFDPSNLVALCHHCHVLRHMALGKQSTRYYQEHTEKALDTAINKFI